jgi:hypothetical protein
LQAAGHRRALIDHRPAIVSGMVEAVVHQDGDLVLVLQEKGLPAVPARVRAQQAEPLRARRQHGLRDLFDEPIVEGSAQLAQTAVLGKQPGAIDHAGSLISMKER